MAREIPTFHDAYLAMERFAARRGVGVSTEDIRAAVIDAYDEIVDANTWAYQKKKYRVNLAASQSTGTVAYDYDNNELTLTGATWPTTAIDWSVVISDVTYDIASRTSSTVVTLDTVQRPTADIAASTSYEAFRRYHILPDDFLSASDPVSETSSTALGTNTSMENLLSLQRRSPDSAESTFWAIGPVADVYGRMGLFTWPASNTAETIDIWYRSRPRPLRYVGVEKKCSVGTIAVTAASESVTGTSTTFEDAMEGSIFRIGDHATYQPTGNKGARPWVEQRNSILTYASTTAITLDDEVVTTQSGVKYTVTDPLDIAMPAVPALLRIAERNISQALGGKNVLLDVRRAENAVRTARGASNVTGNRKRIAGADGVYPIRWTTSEYSEE